MNACRMWLFSVVKEVVDLEIVLCDIHKLCSENTFPIPTNLRTGRNDIGRRMHPYPSLALAPEPSETLRFDRTA